MLEREYRENTTVAMTAVLESWWLDVGEAAKQADAKQLNKKLSWLKRVRLVPPAGSHHSQHSQAAHIARETHTTADLHCLHGSSSAAAGATGALRPGQPAGGPGEHTDQLSPTNSNPLDSHHTLSD